MVLRQGFLSPGTPASHRWVRLQPRQYLRAPWAHTVVWKKGLSQVTRAAPLCTESRTEFLRPSPCPAQLQSRKWAQKGGVCPNPSLCAQRETGLGEVLVSNWHSEPSVLFPQQHINQPTENDWAAVREGFPSHFSGTVLRALTRTWFQPQGTLDCGYQSGQATLQLLLLSSLRDPSQLFTLHPGEMS